MSIRILDRSRALENVGGDPDLLLEVIEQFLAGCEAHLVEIRGAIGAQDAILLRESTHRLKGSLSLLGAGEACSVAGRLESLAQAEQFADASEAGERLEEAMRELIGALEEAARTGSP